MDLGTNRQGELCTCQCSTLDACLFVTSSKEIFCATLLAGVILSCKLLWLLGAVDKFTSVAVRGEE